FGSHVSTNYFDAVGVRAIRGRTFTAEDDRLEGSGLVTIISYRIWQERFQGSDDAIGQHITLNGQDATVIGVAPPKFQGIDLGFPEDVWVPVVSYFRAQGREPLLMERDNPESVMILGQLAPDVRLPEAEAEIRTISNRLKAAYPAPHRNATARLVKYSGTTN